MATTDATERPLAGPVTVRIGNRAMVTDCIVGPARSETVIGEVVLKRLDLVCANHTLEPRDARYPVLKAKRMDEVLAAGS